MIVKIASKDNICYSGEYVLQSGYYWHGQIQIEIQPVDEGEFIIRELHRPTKWHINRKGDLNNIEEISVFRILELPLEIVLPGNGPITDKRGVRAVRDYLVYVRKEAMTRFEAGLRSGKKGHDLWYGWTVKGPHMAKRIR